MHYSVEKISNINFIQRWNAIF